MAIAEDPLRTRVRPMDTEMSFFAMPPAQTWLAIPMVKATESICPLQAKNVLCRAAPGQAYFALTFVQKNGMNPISLLST